MSTGDRPIFPLANQRLDKVDVEAISDLVGENIMRTVGALLGPCGGLLSDVTTTYDGTGGTLTIGACRLSYAGLAAGSTTNYDGGIVRWDPTYSTGGGVVNVAMLGTTSGSSGYIFFKKSELETDENNRAYYDALAQEKKVGVANTRARETALFTVGSTYTSFNASDGYFPFLYLVWNTTGGSPTVYRISAFDSFGPVGSQLLNVQLLRKTSSLYGYGIPWSEGHVGLARMVREIVGGLQHAYDKDFTLSSDGSIATNVSDLVYRWAGYGLSRGIKQLDEDLTTAETTLSPVPGQITDINSALTPIAVWQNTYVDKQPLLHAVIPVGPGDSGAGYALTPTNQVYYVQPGVTPIPIPSWVRQTDGRLELTWTSPFFTQNDTVVQLTAFSPSGTTYGAVVCSYRWNGTSHLYIYTRDVESATWVNASLAVSIFNVGQTTT